MAQAKRSRQKSKVSNFIGKALGQLAFLHLLICGGVVLFLPLGLTAQTSVNHTNYDADKTLRSNARINPSILAMEFSIPLPSCLGRAGTAVPADRETFSKPCD